MRGTRTSGTPYLLIALVTGAVLAAAFMAFTPADDTSPLAHVTDDGDSGAFDEVIESVGRGRR